MVTGNRLSLLVLLISLTLAGCNRAVPTWSASVAIAPGQEPVQTETQVAPFIARVKGIDFTVTPLADYRIAARVAGKKYYYGGWSGELAPVDLALAWGELALDQNQQFLKYSQHSRWFFFRLRSDSPFDTRYVIEHAANNHLIPSNNNVRAALKKVKPDQFVALEGYLVNVESNDHGQRYTWRSSLSRTDSGAGACELFYVTSVQIEMLIYE